MNGVIYARYSAGPGQTDQSIEGQLRDCRDYAKKNNITIIDTYIDRHISGTDFENRQEFNRLLKDAAKHQFSCVIVWKIDRFGRNREELAISKVKLKKCNVQLLYAKEHIPEGPEGIILESLLEGMAEYYSAELAQKVRRGLRESALKGHALGANPCLGFHIVDKKYVLDPETAPVVREIFERYAAGETARQICDDLNRRGVRTAKGEAFKCGTIYFALRNEKYTGIYRYGDIVLTDVIPRIVPQDLYERVQDILVSNSRNRSKTRCTAVSEFLLTGKLFCGHCKNKMIGESGTGRSRTYYYYKCSGRKNKKMPCPLPTYKKEALEELVIRSTVEIVLTDDLIDHLVKEILQIQQQDIQSAYLKSMEKQLKAVQKSIDNLVRAIEMGIITDSTKDRLVELEGQKEALNVEIAKESIKKPEITEDKIRFWLYSFKAGDINDPAFGIRLINTFIHSIYIYEDHMLIVYNFTDGKAQRKAIEADIAKIEKDHTYSGSSKYGRVPATEEQSNHLALVTVYYFIYFLSFKAENM